MSEIKCEVTARLTKKFETEEVGKNNLKMRQFVLTTDGDYPKEMHFKLWKSELFNGR